MHNGKETVKLISGVGLAGEILLPGRLLEADKEKADSLIARGRAVLATDEEKTQAAAAGQVPSAGGPWMQSA